MGKVFKGFFLLVAGIVVSVSAYVGWFVFLPVSETDASARLWNACLIGQAFYSRGYSYTSCSCFVKRLDINETNVAEISAQAEVVRRIAIAFHKAYWNGADNVYGIQPEVRDIYWRAEPLMRKILAADKGCKVRVSRS